MAGKENAAALNIKDDYWVGAHREKTLAQAGDEHPAVLKQISDGPVARYLNRPISFRITKYLLKTGVRPNHVSLFSFLLSVLAAALFFLGGYASLVIGAILAQISSIIDGCDGEIARLKSQVTEFGGWFDAVLDRYADAFLLLGLTYHVYVLGRNPVILFIGFLAIIGAFMNSYTADKYDGFMKRKLGAKGYYLRMGRDVRMFAIFLGAIINQPLSALLLIALVANAENIRRIIVLHKNG